MLLLTFYLLFNKDVLRQQNHQSTNHRVSEWRNFPIFVPISGEVSINLQSSETNRVKWIGYGGWGGGPFFIWWSRLIVSRVWLISVLAYWVVYSSLLSYSFIDSTIRDNKASGDDVFSSCCVLICCFATAVDSLRISSIVFAFFVLIDY